MSVGVMTIGVMSVGEITVGVMTVKNMKYWHSPLPFGQHISVSTLVDINKKYTKCTSKEKLLGKTSNITTMYKKTIKH
jgi:hypothetical protein